MIMSNYPKELINSIAQSIDAGFICFVNPLSKEMEEVPQLFIEDPHEYEMVTGFTAETMNLKYTNWETYLTIEPLRSHDSFKIMEAFADEMEDSALQQELFNALNRRRPFAHFKAIIDDSPFRQAWFDFKQQKLEAYVNDELNDSSLDF
ncbi:hypothetical protein DMA11_04210 [Marinilabiliaceae bacterium JC017]|nr:hypothetical protein DMA11_04210 [Marinilabiliaceae bacterium JC017]